MLIDLGLCPSWSRRDQGEGSRDRTRCFELPYFFVTGAADARMASAAGRWTLRRERTLNGARADGPDEIASCRLLWAAFLVVCASPDGPTGRIRPGLVVVDVVSVRVGAEGFTVGCEGGVCGPRASTMQPQASRSGLAGI